MCYRFKIYQVFFYSLFVSPLAFSFENQLTVSVPSFAPFYFVSDKQQCQGIAVEILKKITEQTIDSVQLLNYPYARIIRSLESGQLDLALIFKNSSISDSVYYIGPVSQSKVIVLTHQSKPIKHYSELSKLSAIAVIRNAQFENKFDNDDTLTKVAVESYQQAIKMFKLGRVDAVVGSLVGLDYELRAQKLSVDMLGQAFVLGKKEWWLHLSKKSAYQHLLPTLTLAAKNAYQADLIYQSYLNYIKNCQTNN